MKGNPVSSDAKDRWEAICHVAGQIGLSIDPELTMQIETDDPTPMLGYPFTKQLLARENLSPRIFAYNDISAIGAIRALQEQGLRVPQDVSVMGFDDIPGAAFHTPSLTTVHQPLNRMGEVAAQSLLERIEGKKEYPLEIAIEPELVVRESTAKAPGPASCRVQRYSLPVEWPVAKALMSCPRCLNPGFRRRPRPSPSLHMWRSCPSGLQPCFSGRCCQLFPPGGR